MRFKIQKTPLNKSTLLLAFAVAAAVRISVAGASNFGPYSYVSHDVSVCYAQAKRDTWTWKFLNSSSDTTITYMTFKYTDKDGQHDAVLPGKLKPGTSIGGWAVFTASSRPTITIKQIKRAAQ